VRKILILIFFFDLFSYFSDIQQMLPEAFRRLGMAREEIEVEADKAAVDRADLLNTPMGIITVVECEVHNYYAIRSHFNEHFHSFPFYVNYFL
jgi:hypothetical protein